MFEQEPGTKRLWVQSSMVTMRKDAADENYQFILDIPEEAALVVNDFQALDSEQAHLWITVVQQVDPDELSDDVPLAD